MFTVDMIEFYCFVIFFFTETENLFRRSWYCEFQFKKITRQKTRLEPPFTRCKLIQYQNFIISFGFSISTTTQYSHTTDCAIFSCAYDVTQISIVWSWFRWEKKHFDASPAYIFQHHQMENDFLLFWMKRTHQEKSLCFNAVSVVSHDMFYIFFLFVVQFYWYDVTLLEFFYVKMKICCVMCFEWNDETCAFIGISLSRTITMRKKTGSVLLIRKTWIQWFLLTHWVQWNTHDDYEWRKTGISTAKWDDEK